MQNKIPSKGPTYRGCLLERNLRGGSARDPIMEQFCMICSVNTFARERLLLEEISKTSARERLLLGKDFKDFRGEVFAAKTRGGGVFSGPYCKIFSKDFCSGKTSKTSAWGNPEDFCLRGSSRGRLLLGPPSGYYPKGRPFGKHRDKP